MVFSSLPVPTLRLPPGVLYSAVLLSPTMLYCYSLLYTALPCFALLKSTSTSLQFFFVHSATLPRTLILSTSWFTAPLCPTLLLCYTLLLCSALLHFTLLLYSTLLLCSYLLYSCYSTLLYCTVLLVCPVWYRITWLSCLVLPCAPVTIYDTAVSGISLPPQPF